MLESCANNQNRLCWQNWLADGLPLTLSCTHCLFIYPDKRSEPADSPRSSVAKRRKKYDSNNFSYSLVLRLLSEALLNAS